MDLTKEIAEKIASAGGAIKEIIVKKLSEVEIEKRVSSIVKAFNSLESLGKDLKKIERPDVIVYKDGVEDKSMSKKTYEETQKIKRKIGELTKVTETALEKNDEESYKKLNDFLGNKDGKPEGTNTESSN